MIDDIVIGSHVDEYFSSIRSRPLLLVMLVPSPEAIRAREASRGKQMFDKWAHLDELAREASHVVLWIDSSEQTAEETVDEILRRAEGAAVRT